MTIHAAARAAIASVLGIGLLVSSAAAQTAAPAAASKTTGAPAATAAPSAQEISDAKRRGMVWVNLKTKVYHKDGASYGTTKHGKFMSEDDATKAGYHPSERALDLPRKHQRRDPNSATPRVAD